MKVPLEPISFIVVVLSCLNFVDGRGGNGGGGGGGGGRGGGVNGGNGGGGARGAFGRSSGSRGLSTRNRVGGAAVILGSGAAGYAAYKAHQNAKKDRERGGEGKENSDFDSYEHYEPDAKYDYKTQESTSYYATEGIGMSAWALICIILTVVALGTMGYYCCTVFLPVWQDNRQMRRRSVMGRMKDVIN